MKEYKICKIKKPYEQTDKYMENNNTCTCTQLCSNSLLYQI